MSFYRFELLNKDGKTEKGVVELPFTDVSPAIRYLERQGGIILEITQLAPLAEAYVKVISKRFQRVGRIELAEFFNNLSMLLSAGVPVLTALKDIQEDVKNPVLSMTIKMMSTDISSGQTFSEAASRHDRVFTPVLLQMIVIGEETGRLDKMLLKGAEHLNHIQEIISATKRALIYPAFLVVLVTGATVFWFAYVVPKIVGLFKEMNVTLPTITKVLIAVSEFFQNYLGLMALTLFVVTVGTIILRKKNLAFRYTTDLVLLKTPILSNILETSLVARITEYLGILIGAGIGVLRTLEMLTETMTNTVYQRRLLLVQENLKGGNTLSQSLRSAGAMHPFAIRMIAVGEQSGKIEEQTEYVARVYRNRLSALVEVLGKTLEPALIVFLGLMFALIIAGLLLPIYDLVGGLK